MGNQENCTVFAGFCILVVIMVSLAGCINPDSVSHPPVSVQGQSDQTDITPVAVSPESAVTPTVHLNQTGITPVPATTKSAIIPAAQPNQTVITPVRGTTKPTVTRVPTKTSNQPKLSNTSPWGPVSITIHSAKKVSRVKGNGTTGNGTRAAEGHVFILLDVTIRNNEIPEGLVFTDRSITMKNLKDNYYVACSLNGLPEIQEELENAIIPPVTIARNKAISGKILFGLTDSDTYAMRLVDSNKTVLARRFVNFT